MSKIAKVRARQLIDCKCPYFREEHVHRPHGFAVLVLLHIESLDLLGVVD